MIKRELLWIPFFGWGLAMMRPWRSTARRGMRALKQMLAQGKERLHAGFWIVVFPEGTRAAPGEQRRISTGGAALAVHAARRCCPSRTTQASCWPRHAFRKQPGTMTVRIGPPIERAPSRPERSTRGGGHGSKSSKKRVPLMPPRARSRGAVPLRAPAPPHARPAVAPTA